MPAVSKSAKLLRERALRSGRTMAYGYTRVSHDNSFKKGDSLPAQEQRITDYYDAHLRSSADWGGVRNDGQSVSAFRVPFGIRPAGRDIMARLEAGDHLIMDKPDRVWRSMTDFVHLMEDLKNRDVTVHIVNFLGQSIKNNTAMGEFVLGIFVMTAQLESTIKSERIKEGQAVARKKGTLKGRWFPGCYYDENKQLQWDRRERAVMNEIMRLKEEMLLPWSKAFLFIEKFESELYGRPVRPDEEQSFDRRKRWRRMYREERAYRYLGITDPSQIPHNEQIIIEAKRQWIRIQTETHMYAKSKAWRRVVASGENNYSSIEEITPEQLLKMV